MRCSQCNKEIETLHHYSMHYNYSNVRLTTLRFCASCFHEMAGDMFIQLLAPEKNDREISEEEKILVQKGLSLSAVKSFRSRTGCDTSEAIGFIKGYKEFNHKKIL